MSQQRTYRCVESARICEDDFHFIALRTQRITKDPDESKNLLRVRCVRCVRQDLIAEGNIDIARRLDHLAVGRNKLKPINGFGDGHLTHLIILIADHRSKMSFVG